MKKIYLVATFRKIDAKYGVEGSRTVGWFPTKKDAVRCITENWGDIYEDGWYPYAVIEDVQPGLYMSCESTPIFFKWEGTIKEGGYKKIKKPAELNNIFGFTIG